MPSPEFHHVEQLSHCRPFSVSLPSRVASISPALLASYATWALIEEAHLTPKPALVDRNGKGAHHDLSLALLVRSAKLLEEHFLKIAEASHRKPAGVELRHRLGALGRRAEAEMLAATGGVNTHRGAIWSLGLLVAACSQQTDISAAAICRRARDLARIPDTNGRDANTHGSKVRVKYGFGGARSEAQAGFPHVVEVGLPALRCSRSRGHSEAHARLDALLAIMATLADTCLLHRGGTSSLLAAQHGAAHVLELGGSPTVAGAKALSNLHETLMSLWASPGGSADLLAATLFLDLLSTTPGRSA